MQEEKFFVHSSFKSLDVPMHLIYSIHRYNTFKLELLSHLLMLNNFVENKHLDMFIVIGSHRGVAKLFFY